VRPLQRLFSILALACVAAQAQTQAKKQIQTLTITHASVVDVTDGTVHPDTTVVIEGNRIKSVGHTGKHTPSIGQIVDAHGQYLIPGLWDMHTHVYFDGMADEGSDLILPLFLANGITGVRDMGSDLDRVLSARSAVAAHTLLGPRMVVSGPMLDGPTSHYKAAIAITTPEDGRNAVDMLHSRGVNFIKVQSGIPRDAYFAIAAEAKKDGIEYEGHVPDSIRATEAVASGQRTFEHLIGVFEGSSPAAVETAYLTGKKSPGQFLESYDPAREAELIQLLAREQIWQCPTLFWERGQWLVDAIDYSHDPDLPYAAHSWLTKHWPSAQRSIMKSMDTDPLPVRERFVDHELDIVRKMHAANIPFLAGTDTPAGVDLLPGVSLHLELQRFVDAGFTPLQALQTATLNPARFFNKLDDYGTIAPGKIADLDLLAKNPLENVANTRTLTGVITDGRYLSPTDLDQLRDKLKQLAANK
jgi:imidazolonepropionase-like amidohydrolase